MTNTDMIAVLSDGTSVTTGDYYSFDRDTPPSDISLGGTNDISLVSSSLSNGYLNATVSRLLVTSDPYDSKIVPDVKTLICWAYRDHGRSQ